MIRIEAWKILSRHLGSCITGNVSELGMPLGAVSPKPLYLSAAGELTEAGCFIQTAAVKWGQSGFNVMDLEHNSNFSPLQKKRRSKAALGPLCQGLVEFGTATEGQTSAPMEETSTISCPRTVAAGPVLPDVLGHMLI